MRPATIIWFERLVPASLLLSPIQLWLFGIGARGIIDVAMNNLVAGAILVTLTLLVSRWRSKVAMWISIALYGVFFSVSLSIAAPFLISVDAGAPALAWGWLGLARVAVPLLAYSLLFTPSARRWMNRETTLDDLGETFA